ncbi:MAG: DUF2079 domain-containing protein, partial [Candidatus Omnitrophota bacterium]
SGGYILFRFASKIINKAWAFVLFLLYLIYPPVIYSNLFEFHPVTLSIPFLFLSFWAYREKEMARFVIFSLLAISCKENIPLVIIMFGALALIERRPLKWICMPVILGLSTFVVLVFFIKSHFNKGIIDLFALYREFGDSPKEIILGMITSPGKVISAITSKDNLNFVIKQLAPVAFLPILGVKNLIPSILILLQHALSWRSTEKVIIFHYAAKFVPFVFISTAYGLKKILSSKYVKELGVLGAPLLMALLLISSIGVNVILEKRIYDTLGRAFRLPSKEKANFINQKYVDMIPKDAAVAATFRYLPKLSQRGQLHSFHHFYMGTYTFSKTMYPLPEKLDYALVDFSDDMAFNFRSPNSYNYLKRFFYRYNWRVVDFDGSVVLFENSDKNDLTSLFSLIKGEPEADRFINGKINDEIELIGFDWSAGEGDKLWEGHFSFYWRCLKDTNKDYNAFVALVNAYGQTVKFDRKYTCYRIYPTHQWREGEVIREDYWYVFPSNMPKMKYYLTMGMVDEADRQAVRFKADKKGVLNSNGFVVLLEI